MSQNSARQRVPPPWTIYAMTIVGMLANPLIVPNLPDVLADFGQPVERAGWLVAVVPLPGIVLAPIVGYLADRLGRKAVVIPCLVIFGVSGLASALAPSFILLLVARFAQGFGSAALLNLSLVIVADHWSGTERATLMGRNAAALSTGLAVAPLLSGVVAQAASWRWSLALAAAALPIALVLGRSLPASLPNPHITLSRQFAGAGAVLRQPVIAATLGTAFVLFVVIFGVFLTTFPLLLDQEFELGPAARGLVLSLPAVGSIAASMRLGRLKRQRSHRWIVVASSLLVGVAALTIGLSPLLIGVLIATVLYGIGEGFLIPALQDTAATATDEERRATVLAAWTSFVRLGQLTGPLAAAALYSASSARIVLIAGAVLFLVVAVVWSSIRLPASVAEL